MTRCRIIQNATVLIAICTGLMYSAPRSWGTEYPILLQRPAKEREHYKLTLKRTDIMKMKTTVDEKVTEDLDGAFALEFDADVSILSVSATGEPTKIRYVVSKFIRRLDKDHNHEGLPPGATFVQIRSGDADTYELDGGAMSEDAAGGLKMLLPPLYAPAFINDQLFGSKQLRAVDASWPMDAEVMAKVLAKDGTKADPQKITGQAKLVETVNVGGLECQKLRLEFDVKDPVLNRPGAPPAESVEIKQTTDIVLPVDLTKGRRGYVSRFIFSGKTREKMPDGKESILSGSTEVIFEEKRDY